MAAAQDAEGLTPLRLLGKCASSDLARWRGILADRGRGRVGGERRRRSGSLWDDGTDDGTGDERDEGAGEAGRRRVPSFGSVPAADPGGGGRGPAGTARAPSLQRPADTFACEVMTFGRAEHALGVPHYASRRAVEATRNGPLDPATAAAKAAGSSVRPRRVEAFALGAMGRDFASDSDGDGDGDGDGAAVAVAAAAHHTLVATAKGRLFAFGLGKGGRLGTGDDGHRPLPTPVLGPLERRRVFGIAAAVNHSLCSTDDGAVYAWGSNRFGQLGTGDGRTSCVPRRIDDLRRDFVTAVAAAERHSVILTKRGEVYAFGDNGEGQLGSALRGDARKSSPMGSGSSGSDRPIRVEALWSSNPRRRVSAIAAAEHSTLVLALPPWQNERSVFCYVRSLNSVYSWGYGNSVPVKINFPAPSQRRYSVMMIPNPTGIAAAKYHSVAITSNGMVWTWGLHSESLGTTSCDHDSGEWKSSSNKSKRKSSAGSMVIAVPQLVTGMLPERGGGFAVAVSASENHTAVLTDCGHLYTWGANEKSNILGHEGVKWQPVPLRVPGVHRAVGLAVAKEHTALLIGTSFPPLPQPESTAPSDSKKPVLEYGGIPSLQEIVAREIAKHVDLFNVVTLLITAERIACTSLISYCMNFVRKNLDAVIALGKKTNLDAYLDESLSGPLLRPDYMYDDDRDASLHPFVVSLATAGSSRSEKFAWIKEWASILQAMPKATFNIRALKKDNPSKPVANQEKMLVQKIAASNIERREEELPALLPYPSKGVVFETDLPLQSPTMNCEGVAKAKVKTFTCPKDMADHERTGAARKPNGKPSHFKCGVCRVICPDANALAMHMSGKKHRNRVRQMEQEEQEKAVKEMLATKRRQMLASDNIDAGRLVSESKPKASETAWKATKGDTASAQPKYRLMPPSPAPRENKPGTPPKSQSLQLIIEEQLKTKTVAKVKKRSLQIHPPLSAEATPRSPWVSAKPITARPLERIPFSPSPSPSSGRKISLGTFLEPKKGPAQKKMGPVWSGAGAVPRRQAGAKTPITPRKAANLHDIQQREEELKAKEDGMCTAGMKGLWYVERRKRAESITAIQGREAEERQMQLLIEEQKAIEAEIVRERNELEMESKQANKPRSGGGRGRNRGRSQRGNRGRAGSDRQDDRKKGNS